MSGDDFLIVGLGASAGGIKAFRAFLEQVPADSGMAYVVILHLSPEFESRLPEVLQRSATIPVMQVVDRVAVEPNHVYVIPPNKSLAMVDGHLALSPITRIEERRAPIDIFFRTLAECQGARAASVVLSGTGADGSMGLKRVKERGGVCLVQDPHEAEHEDMPLHSIATGLVDYVLPVAEMPAKLLSYGAHRSAPIAHEPPDRLPEDEGVLRDVFTHLRVRTGHDFSSYKPATVLRRLERRMRVHEIATLGEYSRFLQSHADEPQALLKDLLISVTNFFRDRPAFEALERLVIPALLEGKGPDDQVRVWVAGCATGEEAYLIAMLLAERTMGVAGSPSIQVFATDIDTDSLATAREGFYTLTDAADVPAERLARFFVEEQGGFRVRKELRSLVLFAYHNVIRDPPFSHLDLVSCRNLLIYLNPSVQRRIAEVLHFALDPRRYLFLGSSESGDGWADLFAAVDKEQRIFQSRGMSPRPTLTLPEVARRPVGASRDGALPGRAERWRAGRQSYADLHQELLEQYAPPSIVVNEDYDIVHLSARAGRYLQFAGGEPSHNLLRAVRPELRLELRTALYQASRQRTNVRAHGLSLRLNETPETVTLTVKPVLREGDAARGFFLVLFEEGAPPDVAQVEIVEPLAAGGAAHQLEDELIRVKGQLRTTVEQYEAQTEEFKASNEELQAINEELRSSAEELETSKEELQSINEELTTVNQELKIKIEEQAQSNNDILNLVNSTEIGTLFIDRDSRIKLFTPRAKELFSLIGSDLGRPLSDIASTLEHTDLSADISRVLETLTSVEREVRARHGRWYAMRLIPYRTSDDRVDGVVLTFVDITNRKAGENELRESVERLRMAAAAAGMYSWGLDLERQRFEYYTRVEPVLGFMLPEEADAVTPFVHPDDRAVAPAAFDEAIALGREFTFEQRFVSSAGRQVWTRTAGLVLRNADGLPIRVVGTTANIDASKGAEDALRQSAQRLRESEARLRLILESILDYAVIALDSKGRIESWNPGAERAFGYSEAAALSQHIRMLFTEADRQAGVAEQEMAIARAQHRAHADRWHLRKDGSTFFASGMLFPRRDAAGTLSGYVRIARDLTERKQYEDALRTAHAELEARVQERTRELADANSALGQEVEERRAGEERVKSLLKRLVTVQKDERRRIARDLHDHLGQQMTALRLNLDALKSRSDTTAELQERLEQADRIAEGLDADVEFLAWELRPAGLDDIGLPGTLDKFLREWSDHYNIAADLHVSGMDHERLDPDIETNLYRIAQEALHNVVKHAHANRADVLLERRDGQVVLIIEDDGVGYEPGGAPAHAGERGLGVIGMRERAALAGGTLDIESQPGSGTTVYVRLPEPRS